jgi:hypothetical protein
LTFSAPAIDDQDDACRDARVEDERERLVSGVFFRARNHSIARRRRSRRRVRSAPAGARAGTRPRPSKRHVADGRPRSG